MVVCLALLLEGMSSSSINVQVVDIRDAFQIGPAVLGVVVSIQPFALNELNDEDFTVTSEDVAEVVGNVLRMQGLLGRWVDNRW